MDSLTKKIHFLEFMQKHNINSVEYYLNNYLKNQKLENNQEDDPAQIGNSTIRKVNTNLGNVSQDDEEIIPYNINEHEMPLLDEENIIKILKNNDYFQDQTNDIFNLVLNETIYISVFKGMKIYDINDTSNYFFIINKGSVNLEKNEKNKQNNGNNYKKTFGPWESFGEISFYNGKTRNEVMVANDNAELYAIDSESFRELIKRNNEIVLKEKYNFLNNISIFESLDKISKYNVAQKLKKREFSPNTKIIKTGEIGETLYIIKE